MSQWKPRERTMPVALIRPPVNRWSLYGFYAPLASREAPLGLLYLASYLSERGGSAKVFDGELLGMRRLLAELRISKPGIIGVTSTTFSFNQARALILALRDMFSDCLIVMGGSHASAIPEDTLERIEPLDACIVGEGEEALWELIDGRGPESIGGLVWRDIDGRIRSNPARERTIQLDRYRLDFGFLPDFPDKYTPGVQDSGRVKTVSLVAGRGCYYRCTFCAGPTIHGRVRRCHSPQYLVDLMVDLHLNYGIANFYFHDDNFTQDQDWLLDLCNRLSRLPMRLRWSCASRVESLTDHLLAEMKRAGCYQIGVGLESGSDTVLEWLNKGITYQRMKEAIDRIHASGIETKVYIIIGTPTESVADLIMTWLRILRLGATHLQIVYFTPLPGTVDWQRCPIPESKWQRMNLLTPMAVPKLRQVGKRIVEFGFYASFYATRLPGNLCKAIRSVVSREKNDD